VLVVRPDLPPEQRQVMDDLYRDLCEECPEHLVPFDGRMDVQVGPNTVFRPDFQVFSREVGDAARVLVVDALPGRDMWYRAPNRDVKRHGYKKAGVASYWICDPVTATVAVYEINYLKRSKFPCGDVCVTGRRNRWGLWSDAA
jgi:hypothetical protein